MASSEDRDRIRRELVAHTLPTERARMLVLSWVVSVAGLAYAINHLLPGGGSAMPLPVGVPAWLPPTVLGSLLVYSALVAGLLRIPGLSAWVFAVSSVVEGLLPTVAIGVVAKVVSPFVALVSPLVLFYPLFFMASALRLRPALTMVTAVASGVSYACLALWLLPGLQAGTPQLTLPLHHLVKATLLMGEGLVMAWVARRITQQTVEIATAALDHDRELHEARVEAEVAREANHAKGAFLANMSHELRTPLNVILGYSELVAEELDEASVHPDIGGDVLRISSAGRHLLQLVDDVLDLSKIESDDLSLECVSFDLATLVAEAGGAVAPMVHREGGTLRVSVHADGQVRGDPTRLRQVVLNLLSNATKFAPGGAVALRVGWHDGEAVIEVEDDGIGMTEAQLERVFDRFAQADPSTTRRYGGTGLGLTITRGIVETMGGTVLARSTPGVGSVFTVRVPLPAAESELVAS